MSDINFCNTKEQLNHLGEVVTGKVNGSPTGSDIETSTLPYTGQVRKTLPALEGEYEKSIADKEAEADDVIDSYRLLNKGDYSSGITLESKFEFITYNGESYFATNPPYTTTETTPDVDGNLFIGNYITSDFGLVTSGTEVKHRRGTDAEIASGVPAIGELWFNTTDSSIHMGDGATQGGIKHLNVDLTNLVFDTVADMTTASPPVGSKVTIVERDNYTFEVVSGGSPDGKRVLDAGGGNTAVFVSVASFTAKAVGEAGGGAIVRGGKATVSDFPNRGPLLIMNNPSTVAAGECAGQQILIGDNPTGTPGAGDFIAQQVIMNNLNGRSSLWAQNILAVQDPSGSDGAVRCAEFEVAGTFGDANPDPFSPTNGPVFRKNGVELVGHGGSNGRLTSALTVWANDLTGDKWWREGISISRCATNGIQFYQNAGGSSEDINAFQNAAILDGSNSASVIKVDGFHTNAINFSTVNSLDNFVLLSNGAAQNLKIKSSADFDGGIDIDTGVSAIQNSNLIFSDRGSAKWYIQKNTAQALGIVDIAGGGITTIQFDGDVTNSVLINVNGTLKRITQGSNDSAGAGFAVLRVSN
ncbi:hypothetical protein NVP1060A_35 [Vibrio phage 1.060.A._10N.261.48.B5]|nr:hypothetical protein NVP1060A_35 [Vibrio phage 1.060.A._10N.261.48.B5]